jgi:hypothetical protein
VDVFVDLEVVVVGSDLERMVVVEDEGGTYELSAAEAIHQRLPTEYGIRYVQETTTGATSELDSALEEASALELAAEEAAAEEEEEDKQESSPPPTFIFWT